MLYLQAFRCGHVQMELPHVGEQVCENQKVLPRPTAVAQMLELLPSAPVRQASANTDRPLFQARCTASGEVHELGVFSRFALSEPFRASQMTSWKRAASPSLLSPRSSQST